VIIEGAVLGALAIGETDTSGLFDIENVRLAVPRILAWMELGAARLDPEWTVLLHEAEH